MTPVILKIVDEPSWRQAVAAGAFEGSPVDLSDGFLHFSTPAQVRETADRHFAGREGLLLVAVAAEPLGSALRWEPSRGGDLFPHLYGLLPMAAVRAVVPLPLDAFGRHVFPDTLDAGSAGTIAL